MRVKQGNLPLIVDGSPLLDQERSASAIPALAGCGPTRRRLGDTTHNLSSSSHAAGLSDILHGLAGRVTVGRSMVTAPHGWCLPGSSIAYRHRRRQNQHPPSQAYFVLF